MSAALRIPFRFCANKAKVLWCRFISKTVAFSVTRNSNSHIHRLIVSEDNCCLVFIHTKSLLKTVKDLEINMYNQGHLTFF